MEGAAPFLWSPDSWFPDFSKGLALSWDPSASVSDEPLSYQIPKTIDTNLKRQLSGATRDAAAEKKRRIDKAYRERCKEDKLNTKMKLDALTNENDRLRRENDCLKNEEVRLTQALQHQKDGMNKLEKEFGQLKGQLHSQNTIVEVLSKRLVSVSPFSSFALLFYKTSIL
ncbi:unnamed protein product [Dovyalis caffra]|uniref:BZIP domain-containing protein n=1 Tax=Dovyalis caffra TaxID=77055 RepID=A0AAV1RGN5_9ROSI|nr:unnamed protein product [Dovyalis caffra]